MPVVCLAQSSSAMAADIVESSKLMIAAAHDDEAFVSQRREKEVSGLWELANVTEAEPVAIENVRLLLCEDRR